MIDAPYWLALGDIHDNASRLEEIPELAGASGIIVTGDITLDGGIREAARVLAPIAKRVPVLLAQIGNMDREEITGWLEEKGWNLHARARALFPGMVALGVGGSPFTPFNTPSEFPESQLAEWLERALEEARAAFPGIGRPDPPSGNAANRPQVVLVAHTPPHASACDRLHNGIAVGSTAVRKFIEDHQPDICLCGHIHESRAEDHIGRTHVINPGAFNAGGYVVLRKGASRASAQLRVL